MKPKIHTIPIVIIILTLCLASLCWRFSEYQKEASKESTPENLIDLKHPNLPISLTNLPSGSGEALMHDWVMGEPIAVSNALYFGKPPEGYEIVCDGRGHYTASRGGYAFDVMDVNVRTNEFEAIAVAWRIELIKPSTVPDYKPKYNWKDCN